MEQEEFSFSIDWKRLKIPCTTALYKIPNVMIRDVSFSSTSPDVLYILTRNNKILSLHITTLTLTEMSITGLQSIATDIWRLLCLCMYVAGKQFTSVLFKESP